ncbi:TetR/AcrR family transcriptional regulator [Rothia sp. ZJ932]|uniref:TetR/AcrR family transcriptional regulator n=1 Tax=Rothia sp. ZJ932 TaxID=2810516 RepID=UPI0019680305|nr:TetR/AcrR family transcriptional regulator [Rothia sp. ZJ932]QRZ61939.1 TetR/AcrR family transcriptional regulator [Rothia sp. ZJ932]
MPQKPPVDKRRARSAASRKAILDAAESIVRAKGIDAFTTKTLVAKSGLSERTIFNHFDNLDQILVTRISEYLAPLASPDTNTPYPVLPPESVRELPDLIEATFIEALETPRVQKALDQFFSLALAVATRSEDLLAEQMLKTLATVAQQNINTTHERHPHLSLEQRFDVALYVNNLTYSLVIGFSKGVEVLGHQGITNPTTSQLLPYFKWAIEQVSAGKPSLAPQNF